MPTDSSQPRHDLRAVAVASHGLASAVAMLVIIGWVWLDLTVLSLTTGTPSDITSSAYYGPSAVQPMQQPELPTLAVSSRLLLPSLARRHPTPEPSATASPSAVPNVLLPFSKVIEVADGLAFIGSGTILQVIDVHNALAPRFLGRSAASGRPNTFRAQDIEVVGTTVFMLCLDENATADRVADNSVVMVYDISNPASPRLLQDLGLREIAFAIIAQDGWLYVGGWSSENHAALRRGLLAIDARQRAALRRGTFLETGVSIWATARLDDRHVVVAGEAKSGPSDTEHASLQVFSLDQPGMPELLRSWVATERGFSRLSSVAVLDGRAYAVTDDFIGSDRIYVLEVSKGTTIDRVAELQVAGHRRCESRFIGSTGAFGAILGMCDSAGEALVTFAPLDRVAVDGLRDISLIGTVPFQSGFDSRKSFEKPMAVEGSHLFILNNDIDIDTLRIVDVTTPGSPTVIGRLR